jgi:hypothetical protein
MRAFDASPRNVVRRVGVFILTAGVIEIRYKKTHSNKYVKTQNHFII